jgi:hypothetical protein
VSSGRAPQLSVTPTKVEAVKELARRLNLSYGNALQYYLESGAYVKDRARRQGEKNLLAQRRAAAGNPILKPRDNYTGQPRRC